MTESTMRHLLTLGMVVLAVAWAVSVLIGWRKRRRIKPPPTPSASDWSRDLREDRPDAQSTGKEEP